MEFVGIIHRIEDLERTTINSNVYEKRGFVLKYIDSTNKEQLVKFYFKNNQIDVIDDYKIGETVKINFDFRGYDTKSGKFFEEKVATAITTIAENKDKKTKNNLIPSTGQRIPDYTRNYEEFPTKLVY